MEKLIELIYKYNEEKEGKRLGLITSVKENNEEIWFDKEKEVMKYECEIISKSYGFIKWLVENKKIDEKKIDTRLVKYVESYYDEEGYWMENSYEDYSYTDTLLMLLAISDTPIDDLISYLK